MIAAVRGPILDMALDHIVIDCAGVGYQVQVTPATIAGLTRGVEATILTTLVVREDSMTLFGFTDSTARGMFSLLQTVTGVGPRLAMATLAVLQPDDLSRALAQGDVKVLMSVPGIGKRVAERLVVDLRDKVSAVSIESGSIVTGGAQSVRRDQVVEALVGLGFSESSAESVVSDVLAANPEGEASTLLRQSLSLLGKAK